MQADKSPRPEAVGLPTEGMALADDAVDELYKRDCVIAQGPLETRLFSLIAAKHAILLEAKGMRHSRLGKNGCRRAWAKHFGLSTRAKPEVIIARIQEDIDKLSIEIRFNNQQELPL